MAETPSVVAVVLNWNNYDDTAACLDSLADLAYSDLEVVLVDNGSTDGSSERLDAEFPDVDVLYTGENLGFGAGNNVGIRHARERGADYVWILNNDVLVPDADLLADLVAAMEADPTVGVLTPTVTAYPETDAVWFERGYLNPWTGNAGHEGFRNWYVDGHGGVPEPDDEGLLDNDYLPFCSALVRTDVFDAVGLYPEEYFLYYGDVNYSARIRRAGYRLATDTATEIYHRESASSDGPLSATLSYYLARNRWVFYRRSGDAVYPTFFLLFWWWLFVEGMYRCLHGEFESARALLEGTAAGIRGETGRGPYP
ncbi:glycosyltransferase family 2 protein [Haloarcula marina]|uniref:glycosyltransferase family 2 protein n=1 Tax=Haloarcula marina TaxID=2961574 RepID=UPI0020B790CC|nr:glycosyltransferase family 2 protein [Halomicroarcula marina]